MEYPNEVLRTYYAEQRAATILPGEGWLRRGLVFEHGCGYDAGGPHDNGLVIAQRGR